MKANELMLGDWVLVDSEPTKVDNIDADSINTTYCSGEVQDYIEKEKLSPIPLTPEILKKNPHRQISLSRYGFPMLVLDGERYVLGDFHYVHELQHALRLCGLNDLADNFKV